MKNPEEKIERFLGNKANAEEAEEVFMYFSEHPELLEKYISDDDLLRKGENEKIASTTTARIAARLKAYIKPEEQQRNVWRLPLRYAAAAALIGTVITIGVRWWINNDHAQTHVQASANTTANPVVMASLVTIQNTDVANKIVTMEDGSLVTMNKGARISFYKPFGTKDRNIELTGNAVFKVAKDPIKPFRVISRGITTTALGTQFRVEPDKHGIKVSLYEGKVKVHEQRAADQTAVFMVKGQVLTVDSSNFSYKFEETNEPGKTHKILLATKDNFSGKDQNTSPDFIVFRKATLGEVFRRIEEEFKMQIIFERSDLKAKDKFTGRFKKDETLESIIASICAINDLAYTVNGNTITITKQ